jgi:ubiquinone/menaquinone biosynthesis C-methylase UbiE
MDDESTSPIRQFVEDYREVRLSEGFVSKDPEFAQQLPFRDATGRNKGTWRVRAFHYLIVRAGLALLPNVRRVLDIGAGNGWMSRRLAASYRVTALDVDAGETGLRALTDSRVSRVCADLEALPLRNASFDVVIAAAAVHYSNRPASVLAESARVLRRGGVLILADSPVYPDAEARDRAWRRTLSYYQKTGYPALARRYRGLTRAELEDDKSFRFATIIPGFGHWKTALASLRGGDRGARLPILFGWKR